PTPATEDLTDLERAVHAALEGGGAYFFRDVADAVARARLDHDGDSPPDPASDDELADALWSLVHRGLVTGDTLAPVRGLLAGGRPAHRTARRATSRSRYGGRPRLGRATLPQRTGPPRVAGRWSLLPPA